MKIFLTYILIAIIGCAEPSEEPASIPGKNQKEVLVAAAQLNEYLPLLEGRNVGMIVNHTSMIGETHVVDTLVALGVNVKKIFAPEHGFRGTADAGEHVKDDRDKKTGLPIISLYGSNRKPDQKALNDIDLLIFDIQDVGVRFYTYISTMSYAMEAAAEKDIAFMVLDRPNPNGHYVDGPVMKKEFTSFIGLHEVPIVHGMTVGEYAQMVNGEYWLSDSMQVDLTVIKAAHYDHETRYHLPIPPSPNLPNMKSVYLYPYIGLFETTAFSVGRGTNKQFQVIGHPDFLEGPYAFIPEDKPGANNPKHESKICMGYDLSHFSEASLYAKRKIDLSWMVMAYAHFNRKDEFFVNPLNGKNYFYRLAGNKQLEKQIEQKIPEDLIRLTWQEELSAFKSIRAKYLLYKDFEKSKKK